MIRKAASKTTPLVEKEGNNFDVSFTDFANRMLNGLTTDYAAYEVVQKYKKFVMTQFFKWVKGLSVKYVGSFNFV